VFFVPAYVIPANTMVTITMKFKVSDTATHGNFVDGYIENYVLTVPGASGTDGPADPAGYTIIDAIKPVVVSATAVPDPAKAGLVTVTVVFNETMNIGVSPSVTVTGLASSPYPVVQSSYSGDTWVGTFTLLDDNEETTATISVGDGQDVAGNVMDLNASAGTFEVDTISPTVDDIKVSDLNITETDVGDFFYVSMNFSETMDTSVAPDIDFSPDVEGSGTLTFNSGAWDLSDTRYTANYTIADVDETAYGVDVDVSGAEDLAGNEDPLTEYDLFDVDTVKPTVDSASASPDPAKDGTVTVTVVFSEAMDTTTSPTVTVTGLASSSYAVVQSSFSGDTWVGTFTLLDDNEDVTATISVSGGKDARGNTMLADATAGTFEVDTIDPIITDIWVSDTLITEADISGTFLVNVTFSEAMDTGVTPDISFSPTVASTLTSGSGAWSVGDTIYTATYTLADADVEVDGVNVTASGGKDPAGNSPAPYEETDMFDIDTKKPTVVSMWLSDTLINEADDGGYFLVNVTFSEAMDTGVTPDISFNPDVETSGTLTFSSDGWSLGDTIYTANYTIDDIDEEEDDVDITVSGAKDKAGNEDPTTYTNMFDVDTIAPTVVGFQISDTNILINEADIPGTFLVNVTFSEAMDTGVTPSISFNPDIETSGTLTKYNGWWTLGNTRYTANYSVADVNEEQVNVSVSVNGAKDLADNTQVPFTASYVFDVDTIAPIITSIHWSVDGMPVTLPESNITVTLIGETGYTATFDIVNVNTSYLAVGVSMVEDPTGVYNGTYTVKYGDDGTYLIDGYLADGSGNVASILGTTNHPCTLYSVGNGTSEWSSDESHSGSYSVELYVKNGAVDWAEVSIPVDIALKDINLLKFWEYIDSYNPNGWSVNILLGVDADGDGVFEADVAEWHVGTNSHTLTALNGDSFVQMDGAVGGPTTGIWTETDALSIAQWWTPNNTGAGFAKSATYPSTFYGSFANFVNVFLPDVTQTSLIPDADARVKCVKLVIGGSGSWMNETAYVDDLKLNSVIYNFELPFKIDTIPPSVISVEVSDTLINEADDGDLFNVTVTYSEDMNTSIAPSIVFDPSVNPTLIAPKFGAWVSSTVYKYTYTVDDVDEEVDDVDVNVTGAEDLAGKVQVDYSAPDMFDIDTIAPTVDDIAVSDDLINEADVGSNFYVSMNFSETMNPAVAPTIEFSPDVE